MAQVRKWFKTLTFLFGLYMVVGGMIHENNLIMGIGAVLLGFYCAEAHRPCTPTES